MEGNPCLDATEAILVKRRFYGYRRVRRILPIKTFLSITRGAIGLEERTKCRCKLQGRALLKHAKEK